MTSFCFRVRGPEKSNLVDLQRKLKSLNTREKNKTKLSVSLHFNTVLMEAYIDINWHYKDPKYPNPLIRKESIEFSKLIRVGGGGGGGSLAQWLAKLLLYPTAMGSIPSFPKKFKISKERNWSYFGGCLEGSGQWLENFDQTRRVVASGWRIRTNT